MSRQTNDMKPARVREPKVRPAYSQTLMVFALLLAATLLCYVPLGKLAFVSYDDPLYVTKNAHVFSGLTGENVRWAFTSLEASNWHPLTWLSHMVDCEFFELNPAGHHYDNLLMHSLNALLLCWLLWKATGHRWRSFYVSALFAAHPVNVQSVAWIAERKNLLSTLFLWLAILAYGWYARNPKWKRYVVVVGAFAASLLSKPMGVTFPFALLLLDYWPLGRLPDPGECHPPEDGQPQTGWGRRLGQLVLEKLPLLAMAAASSWITLVAQKRGGAMHLEAPIPLGARLMNAVFSCFEYVRIAFWPVRLSVYYPYHKLPVWSVACALGMIAGITVAVILLRRRKYLVVGWFWFLGTLVPVIGLVQVGKQSMADRYAYIPLLGLFLMVVWLADEAIQALRLPRVATVAVAAGLLLAAGVVTRINRDYWQDSSTLWGHAHQVIPWPDAIIQINFGEALVSEGRVDQALRQFRAGEQADPHCAEIHADIGAVLEQQKHIPEAVEEFQAALRDGGHDPILASGVYNELALIHLRQAKLDEAWQDYTEVLKIHPESYMALLGRGRVRFLQKRYPDAEEDIAHAISIQPTAEAWALLGTVARDNGDQTESARAFAESNRLRRR